MRSPPNPRDGGESQIGKRGIEIGSKGASGPAKDRAIFPA